jgi:hypothetical protein
VPNIADGTGLSDHSLDWYRQNGYEYLVACSSIYHLTLKDDTQSQERQTFYTSLDRELEVLQEIHPTSSASEVPFIFDEIYGPAISLWHRERPGPTIKVYHLADRIQP